MMPRTFCSSGASVVITRPSTRTVSVGSTRSARLALRPLTSTRPASIQVSSSRREPRPARASTFCNFSLMGGLVVVFTADVLFQHVGSRVIGVSLFFLLCCRLFAELGFIVGQDCVYLIHACLGRLI